MDCKTAAVLLHAYLDREMDRVAQSELEAHLEGCADCARELASLEALGKVVRQGAPRYTAPASLRAQLLAAKDAGDQKEPLSEMHQPRWWAMAAAVALAFVLGAGVMTWRSSYVAESSTRQALLHDLLTSHLRALAATSPVDVISSNRHTVKPWFAGKIGQSPPVQDFVAEGYQLVGGRMDYVGEQRVAVLAYSRGQHVIDVYLLPATAREIEQRPVQVRGFWMAAARVQDQTAWVVADINDQDFTRFLRLLSSPETATPETGVR